MRESILNKVILLIAVILLSSCKTKKAVVAPVTQSAVTSEEPVFSREDILRNINAKQTVFSTISLKAKAKLLIDDKDNDVTLNIRMQKDKVIWVSASIGIEVARVLITPDSLRMFSRFRDVYVSEPFSYIHGYANKHLNFPALQNLLIGNYMSEFAGADAKVDWKDNKASLAGFVDEITYLIKFNSAFKAFQTNLRDEKANRELIVSYSNFVDVEEQILPQTVKISSEAGDKRVEVILNYSDISLNRSLEFPFSVPKKYTNRK
jgi:hypothetical protein